ncbi:MAG: alpha/beta hydrolase-fold protein, partial [Bacteroidales bacterium]
YRGKWFDFVINARWTGNDDGFLKMWIKADDNNYFQKISYKGPTWWNDEDKGPYLKVGLYMGDPGWKGPEERTLFTDEIRIADEKQSFNDVAPPGAVARKKESGQGNVEYITYHSKLNRADIPVMVYTPPGYYSGKQKYPSIYNFHGSGGGSPARQWDRVYRTLTDAIEKGLADPVIYVFVNGMGDRFYANYEEDSLFIERSIITELIPFIDQHYRTVASGKFRAADGFSMGGFGALMIAMKHPDLFSSVVSYGAALIGADRAVRPGELFSSEDHFSQYNPFMLATLNRNKIRKGLAVRLVCGDQDSLMKNNISFINHMDSLRIEVDFVEVKGLAHDTKGLFRETGIESLKFIWKHFKHW